MSPTIVKSDREWQEQLTSEQYHITRKHGTERAFTGIYHDCDEDGTYHCVCCGQPYLAVRTNLIQAQAGHLSRCLLMKLLSVQSQIAAFLWSAQKYIAASVRLI